MRNGLTELERARIHFVTNGLIRGFAFEAYSHSEVKKALEDMYGGKCAYCESLYDATQPEDVEHHRPKGEIETDTGKLVPGYWWLAADWDNLLPSCIDCNRARHQKLYDGTELKTGKGNRFPLDDESRRARAEGAEVEETPLLIDPCREDPTLYIRFEERGKSCIAVPVDPDPSSLSARRARASIDTYGLNRARLVKDRSRYLTRLKLMLRILERLARELDAADDGEKPVIEAHIEDELNMLRTHADGEDRFTSLAEALMNPVLAKLQITL